MRVLESLKLPIPPRSYPYQLSVGQQQAVALARVLAMEPDNLLLDEPCSALDHEVRFGLQDQLQAFVVDHGRAAVLITHDLDEALYMSDEVLVLSKRPTHVRKKFPVPFARPRRHDLLGSHEFTRLREQVMRSFLQELGP